MNSSFITPRSDKNQPALQLQKQVQVCLEASDFGYHSFEAYYLDNLKADCMTGQEKSNYLYPVCHTDLWYSHYRMGSTHDVNSPTHIASPEKKSSQESSTLDIHHGMTAV